jgi:hypothetical protein
LDNGHYTPVIEDAAWNTSDSFDFEIKNLDRATDSITIDVSPVHPDCKGGHEFIVNTKKKPRPLLDHLPIKSAENGGIPQPLIGGQKDFALWRIFAPVQRGRKLERVRCPQVITIHELNRSRLQGIRRLDDKPRIGEIRSQLPGFRPIAAGELSHSQ